MSRTVYYLTGQNRLSTGDYYSRNGVVPIVILQGNGVNIFRADWNWKSDIEFINKRISGPWLAGLWSEDVVKRITLAAWDDNISWQIIIENLKNLVGIMGNRCEGIVFDGEIYSATETGSGGLMNKNAWKAGGRAFQRGGEVRAALGNKLLGQYVLVSDAKEHIGWKQFWGTALKKGDILLDESGFLPRSDKGVAFTKQGVKNLQGRTIRDNRFEGKVPRSSFWIFPWDKEPDLSLFSGKWGVKHG